MDFGIGDRHKEFKQAVLKSARENVEKYPVLLDQLFGVLKECMPESVISTFGFYGTHASMNDKGETRTLASYVGLITIALYTGMRLGELCNLRTQDIVTVNGIRCFHVRPHPEENWSPKTAAGTRLIPLHSHLLQWGVLDLVQEGEHYLFPDLNPSARGRGTDFAQAFSKFKKRLGLPETVTFHSFRHTVSTKLRNQGGNIRELWIDTLLGHEASHRSQGTTTYTSGIAVQNLQQVVEALDYPTFHIPLPPL